MSFLLDQKNITQHPKSSRASIHFGEMKLYLSIGNQKRSVKDTDEDDSERPDLKEPSLCG
jgi:hypothetical protein